MDEIKQLKDAFLREAAAACGSLPALVRVRQPLVHLLTNYVTVTDCVNAILAIGGRAICSHALQETAQVTAGADALVCNLGGTEYYDAMELSAAQAASCGIPLVIDPVGCAASDFRLRMCLHLTEKYHPAAIRGNYAEIAALTDGIFADTGLCEIARAEETTEAVMAETTDAEETAAEMQTARRTQNAVDTSPAVGSGRTGSAGLDSTSSLTSSEEYQLQLHMMAFARQYGTILIASGAVDLCTDGERMIEVTGGTSALKRITGAGCLSTGVLAAFLAASDVRQTTDMEQSGQTAESAKRAAAASAVRYIGLAGEYAHRAVLETGTGAGHFHMYFMDMLSAGDEVFAEQI